MIVRTIASAPKNIFLTFDDGPDALYTPKVLDILQGQGVLATFFLIGEKLKRQPQILRRIRDEGHAIGDHSIDHRFRHFFSSDMKLLDWLERGEACLRSQGVTDSVGFRPPAGVITPPLSRVASAASAPPLVLWSERFYDTLWPVTEGRARRSAASLHGGAIVLLHDLAAKRAGFASVLAIYIEALRARGFTFAPLTRELCLAARSTVR